MNRYGFFLPLLLVLLAGCQLFTQPLNDKGLQGKWTLYDVTMQDRKKASLNMEALLKGALETGSILNFYADGSYTQIAGNGDFDAGSWRLNQDKNLLALTSRQNETSKTPMLVDAPSTEHSSFVLVIPGGRFLYKYIKTANALPDYRQDPFYKTNNEWRITPMHEEDSTRIRERMANYLKHLALLLKATKDQKETVVSFVYSQGPVMIYNGAIGIVPYEKVKRSWKNGFYNDDAAAYAYLLYGDYLSAGQYAGERTGDWIADDYRILMNVYPAFHAEIK